MEERNQRRRSVHWADERETNRPTQTQSIDLRVEVLPTNGRSVHHRKRDGALSAADTLSLYLSDALRDSARQPSFYRRHAHAEADRQRATQKYSSTSGNKDNHVEKVTEPALRPGSPLSRFLQRRFQYENRSFDRLPNAHTPLMVPLLERALVSKSRRPSSLSSGSMERLLREKISDAKRIREQQHRRPHAMENQPPNHKRETPTKPGVFCVKENTMGSPRHSVEVPVPHAKPQRPPFKVKTSSAAPIPSMPETIELPRMNQRIDTETAARRIQHFWRFSTIRRHHEEIATSVETDAQPHETMENELIVEPSADHEINIVGASSDDNGVAEEPSTRANTCVSAAIEQDGEESVGDDTAGKTPSEATIQMDTIGLDEGKQPHDKDDEQAIETNAVDERVKTVMWQDDEWSFLEEGQYATHDLLDAAVHKEDLSIEALVWKRPHIAVEQQEAKRLDQERARRAVAEKKKNKKKHVDQVTIPSTSALPIDITVKEQKIVRVKLRQRKLQRLRLVSRLTRGRIKQREAEREETTESVSVVKENESTPNSSGDHVDTTEQASTTCPDDDVYATMLAQLHRYVVFSDTPLATDSDASSMTMRNDLISVENFLPSSWVDHDCVSEMEEIVNSAASVGFVDTSIESEYDNALADSLTSDVISSGESPIAPLSKVPHASADAAPPAGISVSLYPSHYRTEQEVQRIHSPCSSPASPYDVAKQREFRDALDAFQQSLHASRASSTSELLSGDLFCRNADTTTTAASDDDDDDRIVDAELEAMLREIQRCKHQIAIARLQSS